MSTKIVNLRKEPYDVYIGRKGRGQDGYFGNPFTIAEHGVAAIDKYREWFHDRLKRDEEFARRVEELRGKTLGCFCKPKGCHGDVIVQHLEGHERRER